MRKLETFALLLALLLTPSSLLALEETGGLDIFASEEPVPVVETVEIVEVGFMGYVLARDPDTGVEAWLQVTDETKFKLDDHVALVADRPETAPELVVGQKIKVRHFARESEIQKVWILDAPRDPVLITAEAPSTIEIVGEQIAHAGFDPGLSFLSPR